ncbi:HYC_CC_PP family protein [Urechidicola vernalis]
MKQTFHKILSTLMAVVVLLSTMSFTVSKHYCGDILVDTAIFEELEGCGMQMAMEETESHSEEEKSCCINTEDFVDGEETEQLPIQKVSALDVFFVAAFILTYQELELTDNSNLYFTPYISPPNLEDRVVLFENFRI